MLLYKWPSYIGLDNRIKEVQIIFAVCKSNMKCSLHINAFVISFLECSVAQLKSCKISIFKLYKVMKRSPDTESQK